MRKLPLRLLSISITALTISCTGTIERIKENGIVNVATVPHGGPLIYQKEMELVGPDAKLAERIVDRISKVEIGSEQPAQLRLRWISKSYGSWIAALKNREADLAVGALGIREEAQQYVQFSDPYYTSELVSVVNPTYRPEFRGRKDLKGATIGVRDSTAVRDFVEKQFLESTAAPFKTLDDALLALRRGEVDLVIEDRNMAAYSLDTVPGFRHLEIFPEVVGKIDCGVAMRKRDDDLRQLVNEVIIEAKEENKITQWISEHISSDKLAEIEGRRTSRLENQYKPRKVSIRVSKAANFDFDIYRLANLRFNLTDKKTGKYHRSSPISFQRRVAVSQAAVPPGHYVLSLSQYRLQVPVVIEPQDSSKIAVNLRLRRGGVDVEVR